MKIYQIFMCLIVIMTLTSCNSMSKIRYNEAYRIISKDFFSKEVSIEEFGKDVSGIYIYDSIYPNPLDKKDYSNIYKNILSEKEVIKPIRMDKILKKLSNQNLNNNWELDTKFNTVFKNIVQYREVPNGPLNSVIFSEIKDDQIRIDVVPFFVGRPKYCGSITKYYFKFNKTKIIDTKKWKDHYECW